MDPRDNRQHRIRHQQVVPSYSGAVAPIYSGVDTGADRALLLGGVGCLFLRYDRCRPNSGHESCDVRLQVVASTGPDLP